MTLSFLSRWTANIALLIALLFVTVGSANAELQPMNKNKYYSMQEIIGSGHNFLDKLQII
ncbi:hypothetical protein BscR1v2_011340 [Bartonella schoenbuchensis R1]|uniref:Uncharacterized protein n=1 Tax=Bartonella schoenbuchensis (strain DSM 13525 / NCTC 13165 / R1) TaxID=687861 RepID=A0A1S6XQZ7_BARSR|nr:hypothetical protein BscR1v2_011340 [Bartonella schoenbuchensis R1]